jgi:hypothetical protein
MSVNGDHSRVMTPALVMAQVPLELLLPDPIPIAKPVIIYQQTQFVRGVRAKPWLE